ncbi:hypothetical protein Salat_1443500 [Sesamum alatum]|uniref:Uncharacterized protein n=1 Tax=Sesamum alatum TaxID=300844 RepID=A0AAE1YBV0_9LAMI|nr:hypothetical protein Salat_1443500 [Sesamum alatum]
MDVHKNIPIPSHSDPNSPRSKSFGPNINNPQTLLPETNPIAQLPNSTCRNRQQPNSLHISPAQTSSQPIVIPYPTSPSSYYPRPNPYNLVQPHTKSRQNEVGEHLPPILEPAAPVKTMRRQEGLNNPESSESVVNLGSDLGGLGVYSEKIPVPALSSSFTSSRSEPSQKEGLEMEGLISVPVTFTVGLAVSRGKRRG